MRLGSAILVRHDRLTLGMLICYDVEFPENVRRLAQAGANAVLVPTALPAGGSGEFIAAHMIAVRAFENQMFVAYVDNCGSDGDFAYAGLSRVAAPDGTILAAPHDRDEALLFANIEPAAIPGRGPKTPISPTSRSEKQTARPVRDAPSVNSIKRQPQLAAAPCCCCIC